MIKKEITKWPIVILANYRTGSSELGHQLARIYKADYYPEPIRQTRNIIDEISHRLDANNNQFIVKFMPDQIDADPLHKRLIDMDNFKIKITRQNFVDQCTSYYIAMMTDLWVQRVDSIPNYFVEKNEEVMQKAIRILLRNNYDLDNLPVVYDETITYENLDFSKLPTNRKTTPPTNELLVKATVIRMIDKIKQEGTW